MLMRTKHATDNATRDYSFDDKPGKWGGEYFYSCRCPDPYCDTKRSTSPRKAKAQAEIDAGNRASGT